MKPLDYEAARLRMASLCARSEQCSHDIREKLRRAALPSSDISRVIQFLEDNNFLDDSRFAGSFARDKVAFAGWGRRKIRMYLMQKRLPEHIISEALQTIDIDKYLDALMRVAKSKASRLDLDDIADRQKLFRSLASRGFESELISQTISRIRSLDNEED